MKLHENKIKLHENKIKLHENSQILFFLLLFAFNLEIMNNARSSMITEER